MLILDAMMLINAFRRDAAHAYIAALAVAHDPQLVTTDRGFARFPGLQWHNPIP